MNRAIAQVEIDQALIGNSGILRQRLEISDGVTIEPNRHSLLQVFDERISAALHLGKIVMRSHFLSLQYARSSSRSAFLAEIILMTVSLLRKQ